MERSAVLTNKVSHTELLTGLKQYFGFSNFKGEQEAIINSLMSGQDTFVIMPTGGGKSLCYQLPALMTPGTAIVVSPLIALMKNQVDMIRGYNEDNSIAHFLNSSLSRSQQKAVKKDLTEGKTKLLYVAPETLTKQENIDFFANINISFVAVDEAHCISEWGHDFRPEYRKLRDMITEINPNLSIIALTATATPKVQDDIVKNLDLKEPNIFIASFNRPNLYYEIVPKKDKAHVLTHIVRFISKHPGKSGIIYTLNRRTTEELAKTLSVNNIKAVAYHAGLDAVTRAKRQDQFLKDDIDVIVATIAFGMGIDKPDVRFVMHYNIPKSLENYYQETGRSGRDGQKSWCILYYAHKDVQKLEHLMRDKPLSEREMGAQLIAETVAYVESSACRRRLLLHYFGEFNDSGNCNNCDNCCHPKEKLDVKDSVKIVLDTITDLNERFGIDFVVDVILGRKTPQISTFNFQKLKSFGAGKVMKMDETFWQSLIRQMMLENLIHKDIEEYGLLKITENGKHFLKNPYAIKVSLNHEYDEDQEESLDEGDAEGGQDSAADQVLLDMLFDLRKKVAKQKGLPPFVIFLENSLEEMAILYPTSMAELEKIQGVSKGKASKFGKPFIELIDHYVEDNDIDKPDDFVMKNVANKSALKIYLIQNIDKKIPLETIAENKGLTFEELVECLESIVSSGIKLNLDYWLEEEDIDEEAIEDIFEFFKDSQDGNLEEAYEEFEVDDVSIEQLQLMRIMFLSKYGN